MRKYKDLTQGELHKIKAMAGANRQVINDIENELYLRNKESAEMFFKLLHRISLAHYRRRHTIYKDDSKKVEHVLHLGDLELIRTDGTCPLFQGNYTQYELRDKAGKVLLIVRGRTELKVNGNVWNTESWLGEFKSAIEEYTNENTD